MNDPEILAAALRWHTVHTKRLTIGAENARRLKAERADYRDGTRRYFGPSSSDTGPLLTAIKRTELAALIYKHPRFEALQQDITGARQAVLEAHPVTNRTIKNKAGLVMRLADTATNHRELVAKVEQHQDADFIVLDGPPRIAELTRAILVLADLCLVPVGASVAEIWATSDVLELVEQAKKVRPVDVRMVWTRHRPHTKLAKELTALATQELGLPILKTALALRVAYPEALGSGLTVAEMPDANAKAELRELVAEIRKIVR